MMRANDPRIRQRINQISHNLESANESAQEGFYNFSQEYLAPCFASLGNCLTECTAPCFPSREDQLRRRRRGRAELSFDFYDDWDNGDDAGDGLLGWGNDELDRLLAGSGNVRGADQPRRQRKMSYGTSRARRRSTILPDQRDDPTVIPKSSFIGFLERLPWRIGPRGTKYRPSAADLQERPGRLPRDDEYEDHHDFENQPLMEAAEESDDPDTAKGKGKNGRLRSTTQSSQETTNSLSSRGDLIFSDEDDEDAVPLDDEFALALARRGTVLASDDQPPKRLSRSRRTTSAYSSRSSGQSKGRRRTDTDIIHDVDEPSMAELVKEEESARQEEESEVARRREAAHQLAVSQGFESNQVSSNASRKATPGTSAFSTSPDTRYPRSASVNEDSEQTEPFPSLPVTPASARSAESLPSQAQESEAAASRVQAVETRTNEN